MSEPHASNLPAPAPDDVARLSVSLGLGISDQDATQFTELLSELVTPLARPAAPDPVTARSSETVVSDPVKDPYNAIVRWCDVPARRDGPLSGLRFTLKDSISVAGLPLSCGSALLEDYVPERDSVVTERILGQGGTIVAVTNMDDLAASADGASSIYGPTLNPLDLTRTAGGSSSGAAASLYLDGVDAAIGTDQGGSVRVPASWCGVVGLKPTRGAIPYSGIVGADRHLDHAGILGRDVDVVTRVFAALAGPEDASEEVSPATGDRLGSAPKLADLRFGLLTEALSPDLGVEPAVSEALSAFAAELQAAGAHVVRTSVALHTATAEVETGLSTEGLTAMLLGGGQAYGWQSVTWPSLSRALQLGMRSRAARLSPQVKTALLIGGWLREQFHGEYYTYARRQSRVIREVYDRALRDVDVLLLPATPYPAQPVSPAASIGEAVLRGWTPMANTAQFNVSGHPAISLPLAEVEGLPLGVMLVGRRFEDTRLLAIARALEAALREQPAERAG